VNRITARKKRRPGTCWNGSTCFLIQLRSDLAKDVPIENKLFVGTIRNWHRLSREVEQMLRDRGLLDAE